MRLRFVSVVGSWSFSVAVVARLTPDPDLEESSTPRTFPRWCTACRGVSGQFVLTSHPVEDLALRMKRAGAKTNALAVKRGEPKVLGISEVRTKDLCRCLSTLCPGRSVELVERHCRSCPA